MDPTSNFRNENTIYVTGPDKTGLIALFCISRNTNFNIECTVLLWWLDTVTPDILYNKCSYIAYHFIAISTSYLNAAGFLDSFFQCL